jgi:hypothetical protein
VSWPLAASPSRSAYPERDRRLSVDERQDALTQFRRFYTLIGRRFPFGFGDR